MQIPLIFADGFHAEAQRRWAVSALPPSLLVERGWGWVLFVSRGGAKTQSGLFTDHYLFFPRITRIFAERFLHFPLSIHRELACRT